MSNEWASRNFGRVWGTLASEFTSRWTPWDVREVRRFTFALRQPERVSSLYKEEYGLVPNELGLTEARVQCRRPCGRNDTHGDALRCTRPARWSLSRDSSGAGHGAPLSAPPTLSLVGPGPGGIRATAPFYVALAVWRPSPFIFPHMACAGDLTYRGVVLRRHLYPYWPWTLRGVRTWTDVLTDRQTVCARTLVA